MISPIVFLSSSRKLCAAVTSRLLFLVIFLLPQLSQAAQENFIYSEYYIQNKSTIAGKINLLTMDRVAVKFPLPPAPYNRDRHFGGWIKGIDNNQYCYNTRGLVLKRDSKKSVSANGNCTVQTGSWSDPYTAKSFTKASDIQIDHLVPLKNAYMSGAYEWDGYRRCLYANYMGNRFHLISVSGTENMKKSDKSPREYLPPNKKYTCEYLKVWLQTKYIWNLRFTPTEVTAIKNLARSNSCANKNFEISQNEYQQQLTYMFENQYLCRAAVKTAFGSVVQ